MVEREETSMLFDLWATYLKDKSRRFSGGRTIHHRQVLEAEDM